jgi:hypothetical protein
MSDIQTKAVVEAEITGTAAPGICIGLAGYIISGLSPVGKITRSVVCHHLYERILWGNRK